MKLQPVALSLCFVLAACGGGGHSGSAGAPGAPGKSAYEIWLEQGNTGTEQDYLDSLVAGGTTNNSGNASGDSSSGGGDDLNDISNDKLYFKNTKEWLEHSGYKYSESTINWPGHDSFKQYKYRQESSQAINSTDYIYVYNEKELKLGNYGVYSYVARGEFEPTDSTYVSGYIHNRNGAGANVYTPQDGSVFKGGTLAYLYGAATAKPILLKGNGTFTYDTHNPVLELKFDDYYTITFDKKDVKYATDANVAVSGANFTGISTYDLPTGNYTSATAKYIFPGWGAQTGYTKSGDTEEAFITYGLDFYTNDSRYVPSANSDFSLSGAFGGEKQ